MRLPTPDEVNDAGGQVHHWPDAGAFRRAGGQTDASSKNRDTKFVVSAKPAVYESADDVRNAMEAMDAYFDLFQDGGWTVFVWDTEENEGWSYRHVGPGWADHLPGAAKAAPSTPASAGPDIQAALDAINRHRRSIGQGPLPADWSEQDIAIEARRLGILANPGRAKLKQRLMR